MSKYALIIGVGDYKSNSGVESIPFALNDAWEISRLLRHPRIGQFDELNVVLIRNGDKSFIEKKLIDLFSNKNKEDLIFLYFSCHGYRDSDGSLYLLPSSYEKNYLYSTAISISFIEERMKQSKSKKQILILDSCFSGSIGESIFKSKGDEIFLEQLRGEGRYIMTASSAIQQAMLDADGGYSLFTRYIIDGLKSGAADVDEDGLISAKEIFNYAQLRVIEQSNNAQTPKSWWLEIEGDIFVARSNKASNPLLAEMKLDPEKFLEKMLLWGLSPIIISDGKEVNQKLIVKPIETRKELEKCFYKFPNVVAVKNEIIASTLSKLWLFVSPDETGKSSMLYYLAAELLKEKPKSYFIKVDKVPPVSNSNDLLSIIPRKRGEKISDCVIIFDGILSDSYTQNLIVELKKKKISCWCTCTPEEYKNLDSKFPINELFSVRKVPGFISKDKNTYEAFIKEKLSNLPDEDVQELLIKENITVGRLAAFSNLGLDLNISLQRFSKDQITSEYKSRFAELSKGARFIAQIIAYFGSFPTNIIFEYAKSSSFFNSDDVLELLESDFIQIEKTYLAGQNDLISISNQYEKYITDRLNEHEKIVVLQDLISIAEELDEKAGVSLLLKMINNKVVDLSSEQKERFNQIEMRESGGVFCSNCCKYVRMYNQYCPLCGRGLGEFENSNEELLIQELEKKVDKVVPFPINDNYELASEKSLNWEDIDFSDLMD